jgi:SAM-dependent methyltransferase
MIKYRQTCRSCGHNHLNPIIDLGSQPIQGSFVYPNKPKPPTRGIDSSIMICEIKNGGCGLIQNKVSISPEILYSNYGYRSSVSNTMKNHLTKIVKDLLDFLDFHNINVTRVLDIGANDLFTLKQYPSNIQRVGIDPSNIINEVPKEGIQTIHDCYPSSKVIGTFDIISSIACFYDIEDPTNFCKQIEKALTPNGVWIVEFAYLPAVYDKLAYDGMVHEHLCLYSVATFEHILKRTGLKILKLQENDTNGGSLQAWVIKENNYKFDQESFQKEAIAIKLKEFQMSLEDSNTYIPFMDRVLKHKEDLLTLLKKLKSEGKRIHIYGMSTKLNTILSYCGISTDLIECAAERSPEKFGAKTISGIPMVSEEESRKNVDVYLVGPYHFKEEILKREEETIKKGVKFLFPLPEIEII